MLVFLCWIIMQSRWITEGGDMPPLVNADTPHPYKRTACINECFFLGPRLRIETLASPNIFTYSGVSAPSCPQQSPHVEFCTVFIWWARPQPYCFWILKENFYYYYWQQQKIEKKKEYRFLSVLFKKIYPLSPKFSHTSCVISQKNYQIILIH